MPSAPNVAALNREIVVIEIHDTDSECNHEQTDDDFSLSSYDDEIRAATPKRPRTSTTNAPPAPVSSRRKSKFNFLKLSLELRDRVFSFTHPKTLLRLSWTCKHLHDALHSRRAEFIWKAARLATATAPPIPACPNDVSELRWAHLLFGPPQCSSCSAPNVHTIIFPLRRRACVLCMKKNLMYEKKFPKLYPDYESSLLMLLPYTNIGPWAHGRKSSSKFYWQPDFEKMLANLNVHKAAVAVGAPGSGQAMEAWKAAQIVLALSINESAQAQYAWVNTKDSSEERPEDLRQERKNIVETKLLEEGWDMQFIRSLDYWPTANPTQANISGGVWTTMKKKLEPKLQEIKERHLRWEEEENARRLERERKAAEEELARQLALSKEAEARRVVDEQNAALKELTSKVTLASIEYAKTLRHQLWHTVPSVALIFRMKAVVPFVRDVFDKRPLSAELDKVLERLPALCSKWFDERSRELQNVISIRIPDIHAPHLDLAICVFVCSKACVTCAGFQPPAAAFGLRSEDGPVPFVGLPELLQHERFHQNFSFKGLSSPASAPAHPLTNVIAFSERGSRAAQALLAALSLDVHTARPADLDAVNARFKCGNCVKVDPHQSNMGRVYMDWRRAISHFIAADNPQHRNPLWERLPDDDQFHQIRDESDRRDRKRADAMAQWACARCNVHCFACRDKKAVLMHLQQNHAVSGQTAREGDDYFWAGDAVRPMPSFISTGPRTAATANSVAAKPRNKANWPVFACFVCPTRARRFGAKGVRDHIQAVHKKIAPADVKEMVHFGRME